MNDLALKPHPGPATLAAARIGAPAVVANALLLRRWRPARRVTGGGGA